MDDPREQDQFDRIELYGEIEKARGMIMRKIGRIDERLGEDDE